MNQNALTLTDKKNLNTYSLAASGGDAITASHALAGAWLAGHILLHETATISEFATHTVASISDMADGRLKRWSYIGAAKIIAKVNKVQEPDSALMITPDQWKDMESFGIVDHPGFDHWVDKGYFYTVSAALTKRFAQRGHTKTAALVGLNLAATIPRDILRTKQKNELKSLGGDNHASKLGKYKTLLQNIGIGVLVSPVERYKAGRAVGIGILSVSTAMGLHDYSRNIKHVHYARLHKKISHDSSY